MILRTGTWLGNIQQVEVVPCIGGDGGRSAMLVKYSIQHRPGVKHGNADALSRRPDPEETGGNSKVTGLGHSEEDDDSGGSWSGEEPTFAAPEYGDTEHGGRAGEAPKDP